MLLQARIGDDLLEDAASCENPEVVVTKFINITVCRDDPRPDKRQILQQGEHKIYFPPMKDLFKDQNISSLEFIDLKVSFSTFQLLIAALRPAERGQHYENLRFRLFFYDLLLTSWICTTRY